MKTLLTTTLAAVAFAAAPALAQTDQGGSMPQGEAQTQAAQPQTESSQSFQGGAQSAEGGMTNEQVAASQQRVIESLGAAGLTDVRIMDAAYLVQATTPDDEEVMMIVNSSGQPMSPPQMGQPGSAPADQGMSRPQQGEGSASGDSSSN